MVTDNLRILRVSQSIYPEKMGGVGIHVADMSRKQAEMGHDVTVVTSDYGDGSLPRLEHRDGYTIRRCEEWARPAGNSITPSVLNVLRRELPRHDILHVHSHLYAMSVASAGLSKVYSTPMVLTNHGITSQTAPGWLSRIYNPTIGRIAWERAERVFCYTSEGAARLQDRRVRTPIEVIPNGIDVETFSPGAEGLTEPVILFVGRLQERKGIQFLMRAFANLADTYPSYRLDVVGDGPMRGWCETFVREHEMGDRVRLLGAIPNRDLPELYNRASLFVLPSLNEGLPRTVLEALACETPVVVSDLDGMEGVVEEGGITVPPGDVGELSVVMDELLQDEDRRERMGRRGRQVVVDRYRWNDTVERTVETYYDILSGARSDGRDPRNLHWTGKTMTDRLQLAYLINHIDYGGAEMGMLRLVQGLDPEEFDVHIITLKQTRDELRHEIPDHVQLSECCLRSSPSFSSLIHAFRTIRSADILVSSLYPSVMVGSILGSISQVPQSYAWHHVAVPGKRWKYIQQRFALKISDGVFVDAQATESLVSSWGINVDDIHILPLSGVDVNSFPTVNHEDSETIRIGTVGRLVEKKGYRELLICAKQLPQCEFHVIGDGPLDSIFQDAPENVILHGRVTQKQLYDLWGMFDIYFQPSHWEGLGITVIEGMASGLPVVASDIDGFRESVLHGETGFLVPKKDISEYVKHIEKLSNDSRLRQKMGQHGLRRVEKRYSQEALIKSFCDIVQ